MKENNQKQSTTITEQTIDRPPVAYDQLGGICYARACYPKTPQGIRDAKNHSNLVLKRGDTAHGGYSHDARLGGVEDCGNHLEVSFYSTGPAGGIDGSLVQMTESEKENE